ncbi:Ig-like domain-containing protein [Candidatus Palauibacter soopunensis]|uniref:Ig-like domain-containing protein n=1 Tax=Candidatus Palauibacter soopunensis TaxID=3056739 RepID=UPI002872DD37|nr:Ig-like domain-containing protein [Candidatus Palauibacter soopunensis]
MALKGSGTAALMTILLVACGDSATPPDSSPPPPPMIPPLTVSVSPTEATIVALDDTVRLTAEVRDHTGGVIPAASVSWSSTDASVARVDDSGLVTAQANGTTTIRARTGRGLGDALITVMQIPTSMAVAPARLNFRKIGETAHLTASGVDANGHAIVGDTIAATWSSDDASVASVDSTGLVTAVRNGSAVVRATWRSYAFTVAVTVTDASEDREALESLYRAAGGDAWHSNRSWLSGAPLSEWHGVRVAPNGRVDGLDLTGNGLTGSIPAELGNMANLRFLRLGDNELTGPIPPELGKLNLLESLELLRSGVNGPVPPELGGLISLTQLFLGQNDLSGPLPVEIGDLTRLRNLQLLHNPRLTGILPISLANLRELSSFIAYGTGLCAPLGDAFREWLNGIEDHLLDECAEDDVQRLLLREFFDSTGGESWINGEGWNSDADVGHWYGLASEDGLVRSISLAGNGLTGQIPSSVVTIPKLRDLDLRDNGLVGQIPAGIGYSNALTDLRLGGNAGLEGAFPFSITDLELEVLEYGGTGLCMPPTRGFLDWRERVDVVEGPLCENVEDVRVGLGGYVTQAIQRPEGDVPLVAGRDALLRVFLTSGTSNSFWAPKVVVVLGISGREVLRDTIPARHPVMATFADEGDILRSYNVPVPGELVRPGLEFVIEADPDGLLPLADGSQVRYPAAGAASVGVVETPPMELVVVPVVEAAAPDSSIFEWTNNVADDSREVGLLRYAFPFSEFHARSRETYVTSSALHTMDGQRRLVLEIEGLRAISGGSGYWYGAAATVNGFVRGAGLLAGRASMGKPSIAELAHEVGHNLNLRHAPCGNPLWTEPDFPHPDGGIGAWGYDFRDGTAVSPETRRDVMGYCYGQAWLSDYFWEKVLVHRDSVGTDARVAALRSPKSELLVLWGGVADGELRIEPAYRITSAERLPHGPGPYRLEGFADGVPEFSFSFTPGEDKFGNKYFFFMISARPLDRITLTGPEGTVTIGEDDERTITVVRDGSGSIRGILRDWSGDLPAALEPVAGLDVATYRALGGERR